MRRPIAFLLSGGADSSLVVAISAKIIGQPIRTFVRMRVTDMKYARMVADHIGSNHTEVYFTEEEGLCLKMLVLPKHGIQQLFVYLLDNIWLVNI